MPWFKPRNLFEETFEITIIIKGLDGVLEAIGGILLLIISPDTINHLARWATQGELSSDPHDFIATHLMHTAQSLTHGKALFGALYLLSHGMVKIVLVLALLKNRLWAYPWMIAFLLIFIVYQTYQFSLTHSITMALLTLFDLFVVWLTWREYQRQKARLAPPPKATA